jgi:hypothetical protein
VCRRYEKLTGVRPTLDVPKAGSTEQHELLDYRIDKLLTTGFRLTASLEDEIDATLRICGSTIGAARI